MVAMDCCFLGSEGEEETSAIQVSSDVGAKMMLSLVIPNKGLSVARVVKQLLKDIHRLGHGKIISEIDG